MSHKTEIVFFNASQLTEPRLLEDTKHFLINFGLPSNCAPFIGFENFNNPAIPTPNQVFNIDIKELDEYLMIGGNGAGDPICIDLNLNNEIVYLNHDNSFERVFMNSSISQFSECQLLYKKFIESLNPQFIDKKLLRRKFTDSEFANVKKKFEETDWKCMSENAWWASELDYLLWERDNE